MEAKWDGKDEPPDKAGEEFHSLNFGKPGEG